MATINLIKRTCSVTRTVSTLVLVLSAAQLQFGQAPAPAPPAPAPAQPASSAKPASVQQEAPDTTNAYVDQENLKYIRLWRTIMAPKDVADAFGHRIASHYIAMQITIANRSKDYQWLVQNAAVDVADLLSKETQNPACAPNTTLLMKALSSIMQAQPTSNATRVTSADLSVLRGVAEKGQSLDPRNLAVDSLTGAGVIASGLIGVFRVGHSYAPAVAAFNGPLITAVKEVLPDYTTTQMNRLSDSAFSANAVVGKQQAKVIVIFIPQSDLLTSEQQKTYYKNPEHIYTCPDLRLLKANVDGNFIANVAGAPTPTGVTIDSSEAANFSRDNFSIKGSITGTFFAKATLSLVSPPSGLTVKVEGTPTDTTINFTLSDKTPIMPNTVLEFAIQGQTGDPVHTTYRVSYTPSKPTVKSATPNPFTLKAGESIKVTLTGSNFLPEGMDVVLDSSMGITHSPVTFDSTTQITFDLTATGAAPTDTRTMKVSGTAGISDSSLTLTVTK